MIGENEGVEEEPSALDDSFWSAIVEKESEQQKGQDVMDNSFGSNVTGGMDKSYESVIEMFKPVGVEVHKGDSKKVLSQTE